MNLSRLNGQSLGLIFLDITLSQLVHDLVHYNISFEKENEKDRITAPISSIQDLCYGALDVDVAVFVLVTEPASVV